MPTLSQFLSRFSDYDPVAMPVTQAQAIIHEVVMPIDGMETASLQSALGRVLAQDLISPINVPAHDNAAMDGFALRSADLLAEAATTLRIVGSAFAGHRYLGTLNPGECIAITTGAVMPQECDTVAPHELVHQANESSLSIPAHAVKAGEHCRHRGEDLTAGHPALLQGKLLKPADLGLLASLGIAMVPVRRKLRVAFFSTGDELRSPGEALDPGTVYDSNRYTLFGMLMRLNCEPIDMGIVQDDPAALEQALCAACEQADVVITSGGVSAGAADYTKQIMARLGDIAFWKIAMRPGRPLAFGRISSGGKSAVLFGLPGNPVAVMASFYFFVRDALLRMMGATVVPLPTVRATAQSSLHKKPERTEYQRGILSLDADGHPQVRITGAQGSGILRSMSEANCMVVLPHEAGDVQAGDLVDVVVFDGLV